MDLIFNIFSLFQKTVKKYHATLLTPAAFYLSPSDGVAVLTDSKWSNADADMK